MSARSKMQDAGCKMQDKAGLLAQVEWKRVTQELPDADQTVLVYCPEADLPVWIGYYDGDGDWFECEGCSMDVWPTHWADFPEPPDEEAEVTTKSAKGAKAIRNPQSPIRNCNGGSFLSMLLAMAALGLFCAAVAWAFEGHWQAAGWSAFGAVAAMLLACCDDDADCPRKTPVRLRSGQAPGTETKAEEGRP